MSDLKLVRFFDWTRSKPAVSLLSPLGTKHKLMLEGHAVLPRRRGKVVPARVGCKSKRLGSKGSVGVPSKNYHCEVCEIFVNSETQLSQVKVKKYCIYVSSFYTCHKEEHETYIPIHRHT